MKFFFSLILIFLFTSIVGYAILFFRTHTTTRITEENPSPTVEQEPKKWPDANSRDTIPGLSAKEFEGSDLVLQKVLEKNEAYTRYQIFYKSEGWRISGIMNIPTGTGPFPVLILNHGYIDPAVYKNGQGLGREQDFFACHGYVVFHSDYRNYALSDVDPENEVRPRSGYVEDVLNGISALKKANLPHVDTSRIGMLGHSMGGGVTLNIMVTKPDVALAYVLLAPINSDYKVNFDKWVATEWPETAQQFYDTYGTYEENPDFWNALSAHNYFDRITRPIMLHQGTSDGEVPVVWSRELVSLLKEAGKNIAYYEYPGEPHIFGTAHPLVMERSLQFFDQYMKSKNTP